MRKSFTTVFIRIILTIFPLLACIYTNGQGKEPRLSVTVHFQVNMSYMVENGSFHPATDSVLIGGTMNTWIYAGMRSLDSAYLYEATFDRPIASVDSYRFAIKNSDTTYETVDPMSRFIRVTDTTMTVLNYFGNYNPAAVAMTFNCNMYYQIKAGHFSPAVDFLDVAGNFNNEGAHDILFPRQTDSIYALTMFFDTAMISGPPLTFKFRINGSWETAELQGDTSRTDSLAAQNNSYTCWYNNIDPTVPALPIAYNVAIQDSIVSKHTVTGTYNYEDYNLKPEGKSLYQWYLADSTGGALTAIDSAWHVTFTIDSLYIGKYLVFEVKPITSDSVVGLPVQAWSPSKIAGVGFGEVEAPTARMYPNPLKDKLTVEFLSPVKSVEVLNLMGQMIWSSDNIRSGRITINLENTEPGIYFLRLLDSGDLQRVYKIIKN